MAVLTGLGVLTAALAGLGAAFGFLAWRAVRDWKARGTEDSGGGEDQARRREESRLEEGIANLLCYQAGGGREEER